MGGERIDNMSTCLGKIERIVNHFGDVTNNQKMGSIDPIKVMKAFLILPISYIGFMASTAFIAKGCDMLVKGGVPVEQIELVFGVIVCAFGVFMAGYCLIKPFSMFYKWFEIKEDKKVTNYSEKL